MLIPIVAKLASESLLSLYPIFVKKIGISMTLQMWTRTIAYVLIAAIFVDWSFLKSAIFSSESLLLAIVNLAHIFFSYEGFRHLDSGVSFAIFNTYPIMILLMEVIRPFLFEKSKGTIDKIKQDYVKYLLVLIGLAFFIYDNFSNGGNTHENFSSNTSEDKVNPDFTYGLIMILLAAFTEALIYFLVRIVKTDNHWNHVFISYFLGAVAMTAYVFYNDNFNISKIAETLNNARVGIAAALNGFIGSVGYFLRFYASYNMEAGMFAILSYFGIIMSYVYGIAFNNESLTLSKVLGTLFVILSIKGT
jgi:drug/metabolite transporter (DMT)-like permease